MEISTRMLFQSQYENICTKNTINFFNEFSISFAVKQYSIDITHPHLCAVKQYSNNITHPHLCAVKQDSQFSSDFSFIFRFRQTLGTVQELTSSKLLILLASIPSHWWSKSPIGSMSRLSYVQKKHFLLFNFRRRLYVHLVVVKNVIIVKHLAT
mgnify:CR=1 FL=1